MANRTLDLSGKKFGLLTAHSIVTRDPHVTWYCSCECGGRKDVIGSHLKSGTVKSCGCLRASRSEATKIQPGHAIGEWVCVTYVKTDNQGHHYVWAHSCGRTKTATFSSVNLMKIGRCACTPRVTRPYSKRFHVPTRNTHKNMLARCLDPLHVAYPNYGGRGISVDPRWVEYEEFVEDMGERPVGYELDRINNNLGYCKGNCRWTTRKENLRNTSVNRTFSYEGRKVCIAEIAEIAGIPYPRAYARLMKYGYSVEEAIHGRNYGN